MKVSNNYIIVKIFKIICNFLYNLICKYIYFVVNIFIFFLIEFPSFKISSITDSRCCAANTAKALRYKGLRKDQISRKKKGLPYWTTLS